MRRWIFSLWARLVLGFAVILALALGSVSFYISEVAEREAGDFERQRDEVRDARIARLVTDSYSGQRARGERDWNELQPILERTGPLFGRRIVVRDQEGNIVGDSHRRHGPPWRRRGHLPRHSPVVMGDEQIASVELVPSAPTTTPVNAISEPPVSQMVSALNTYLLWTGIAAGLGGLVLVSLVSRQILSPVQALSAVASRLGRGDLSQRAGESGPMEIKELANSFNRMAGSLQEAEEQRRNLVADVAHELRTPLFNIQGYLEAVKDGLLEPDKETIDTIHGQVLHLGRLVEDLRLLAQAESGGLHLELETDSLDDLVSRAVDAARPRSESNGVGLIFQPAEQLTLVEMDRTRIAQVVSNILDNAVQHTPPGGQVRVGVDSLEGGRVRVTVEDDGEGIPSENLPLVFERFYRVDASRSRSTGGAGLGLTIAKRLVESHGGAIWAESAGATGARVSFELPASGQSLSD